MSDRLMHTLKERVRQLKREEILAYIDELAPEYDTPRVADSYFDDKSTYRLPELLRYYDEEFVKHIYRCILKREADFSGLQAGLSELQVERCSRIQAIGRLRYSGEGEQQGVFVPGLKVAYFLSRLRKLPVVGAVFSALLNLKLLGDFDSEAAHLNEQIQHNRTRLLATEDSVSEHIASRTGNPGGALDTDRASMPQGGAFPDGPATGSEPVALTDVLCLSGEEFVAWIYQRVLSREPTETERAEALQSLADSVTTKVRFAVKLGREAGASPGDLGIVGLKSAYWRERVESLPLLGFLVKLPRLLLLLSRLDSMLEYEATQVSRASKQIAEVEGRLMNHYNNTVRQVKREVVDAMRSQGD